MLARDFLNTNNPNVTNIHLAHRLISIFYTHTDHTDLVRGEGAHGGLEHEIFLNTNNANDTNIICTRILLCFFNAHGSHGSHGSCSRRGAHCYWNTRLLWTRIIRMRILFSTRRRGAQCWLLNVECWIVASGRNVELLNDEYRCSHGGYWTRTIRMR